MDDLLGYDDPPSDDLPAESVLVERVPIEFRPQPAGVQLALPARFQPLPRNRWASANAPFGDAIAAQLRVRCGMKDCKGDLGRISLTVSPEPINGATEHVVFELARGLVERPDGVWAEGNRTQALRKRGQPARARRPHGRREDWDGGRPLGAYEMPAESIGLWRRGGTTVVECPDCHRLVQVHGRRAYVALVVRRAVA